MNGIGIKKVQDIGYHFVAPDFIPKGENEYYLRYKQAGNSTAYRKLTEVEIQQLKNNYNESNNWDDILVAPNFDSGVIKNCSFYGLVRIGNIENCVVETNGLCLKAGLYNCTIISCDIGDNVALHNVQYLSHYIIESGAVLFNVNEMLTTDKAKFGNGIIKEGETDDDRVWVELSNENGGRKIAAFDGITPAVAWMWSKYRSNAPLIKRFLEITKSQYDNKRGYYGTVGKHTIIKNCRTIKDVKMGSHACISGSNKLQNLTIKSCAEAKTEIGEGTELINGIVGYGSKIQYGVKAEQFVTGENTNLKHGVRMFHSFLGDNSTISCCEVLNSLIFPLHEQHHNNSFLCATTIQGQSNIASGATIGSNHNSRGADGEIVAGRGFWPALSLSLKHNSKFASFALLAKAAYPAELNIPYPFALVSRDESCNRTQIMPAYWLMYNMYALARNSWKFAARDKRTQSSQIIEFDYLAPDTVNEIFTAIELLELNTGKAFYKEDNQQTADTLREKGKQILCNDTDLANSLTIVDKEAEASNIDSLLIKVPQAYAAYKDILHYYAIKTLLALWRKNKHNDWNTFIDNIERTERKKWRNAGGQPIREDVLEELFNDLIKGDINSWDAFNNQLKNINNNYDQQNTAHACATLAELHNSNLKDCKWTAWLQQAANISNKLADCTAKSRMKDYTNPYRKMVYDNQKEMEAVLGRYEDDSFVKQTYKTAEEFEREIQSLAVLLSQ